MNTTWCTEREGRDLGQHPETPVVNPGGSYAQSGGRAGDSRFLEAGEADLGAQCAEG